MAIPCLKTMNNNSIEKNGEILFPYTKNPNYYVTKSGKVYSSYVVGGCGRTNINSLHELKYGRDKDGYLRVVISLNGEKRYVKVHTMIVEQFIGDVVPPLVVNHKDGNKQNNNLYNLEITTIQENTVHAHKNGLCGVDTETIVRCGDEIRTYRTIKEFLENEKDLSRHYLGQLRRQEFNNCMLFFKKL